MTAPIQPSYVGLDMDLYYNTGSPLGGTAVWALIANCRDLKKGSSLGEADVSSRDSTNVAGPKLVLKEPLLDERVFTFDIPYDETDASYLALRSARDARSAMEFAFANGPIGTAGTAATGGTAGVVFTRIVLKVFGFDEDQPMTGGNITSVTLKPCKQTQTVRPTTVTVA